MPGINEQLRSRGATYWSCWDEAKLRLVNGDRSFLNTVGLQHTVSGIRKESWNREVIENIISWTTLHKNGIFYGCYSIDLPTHRK